MVNLTLEDVLLFLCFFTMRFLTAGRLGESYCGLLKNRLYLRKEKRREREQMNYLNTKSPLILFEEARNTDIYVDKSMLMDKISSHIRTNSKYICITRPRRFGKTINASMLGAYYTKGYDSSDLFNDLNIAQTDSYLSHLNCHNVIYMDLSQMPDECNQYHQYIASIRKKLRKDILENYSELINDDYDSISQLLKETEDSFIFILDEWDSIFYKKFMSQEDKNAYLQFLKGLLKDQPYVELAYMTGVLPISKYSSGSELNMFDEFNFMNDNIYDLFLGFHEDEVRKLCQEYSTVSYEEVKKWYDGYYLSDGRSLFNPRSVKNALLRGRCLNYWTETGPMNEIADCIEHNVDAVREDVVKLVAGLSIPVKLEGYSASELQMDTRDEILSAMVVYGFLSYHDGMLRIPNHELMEKFQRVLSRKSMGSVREIVLRSREMLDATLDENGEKVAQILEDVHDREIPFLQYNDENALSCVITLCYLAARDVYEIIREARIGKGYCDYLFRPLRPSHPAIILELKVDGSCEQAIAQIREKNYMQKVENCKEILLVGINYDSRNKHHECQIEKIEK